MQAVRRPTDAPALWHPCHGAFSLPVHYGGVHGAWALGVLRRFQGKGCVEVGDTDLERIYTDDGLDSDVGRNLVLLPEE